MVDMHIEHEITDEEQLSGCGWTPFDGWKIHGMPVLVMSRGEIIMENGQVLAKPGRGKFAAPLARFR